MLFTENIFGEIPCAFWPFGYINHMSNHDKQNIGAIINGDGGWFTACLIRLIIKADMDNRRKLFSIYPDEVHAVNVFNYGEEKANEIRG